MTPTCGNCKYWNQDPADIGHETFGGYGYCKNPAVLFTHADSKFSGIDAECDSDSTILFGKDFGCIHFAPKVSDAGD